MVARIKVSNALQRNFYYNENKVAEGVAECLLAANYPIETERLTLALRLKMLQKFAGLNENIKTNSVHISLNFDPSEEKITNGRLKEIAGKYMEEIGFGKQPFLVYRHYDAGHPHIHILTVKIDRTGKGIATHNIGRNQSEAARKKMELQFNLVRASEADKKETVVRSAYAQKIFYGKTASKKAIGSVLRSVIDTYKFCSLPELNAVLHLYNVHADGGQKGSRTEMHHGLLYHILDKDGKSVGVPIKASLFSNKPTLSSLEQKFAENKAGKEPLKKALKNTIDRYFLSSREPDLKTFIKTLDGEGVHVLLRENGHGNIYGITYVDHRSKSVFNGSELGKNYSAKVILERCTLAPAVTEHKQQLNIKEHQTPYREPQGEFAHKQFFEDLLTPEFYNNFIPFALRGRKKKKKKLK